MALSLADSFTNPRERAAIDRGFAQLRNVAPPEARATFPGLVYQIGNLIAASNATIQAALAGVLTGQYATALSLVAGTAAVFVAVLSAMGKEARDAKLTV